MFQFRWLRRLVRKNTNPIPENKAEKWKRRLSLAYMLLAWNAFGMVVYMCSTGRKDWAHYYGYKSDVEAAIPPAQQWARTLHIEKSKVIQISKSGVNSYDLDLKSDKKEAEEESAEVSMDSTDEIKDFTYETVNQ